MIKLKTLAKDALSIMPFTTSRTRVILMHHDVSEIDAPQHSPFYSTTPERFREHINYLSRYFDFVGLDDMFGERAASSSRPLASLTFDDGFLSVKENAMPFLKNKRIPFAVFVSGQAVKSNRLSYSLKYAALNQEYEEKVFLDENDLRELDQNGVLVGNHSMSHKILSECDPQTLEQEVLENRRYLENVLQKPVRHLAIPYGKHVHYNSDVITSCRQFGNDYIYSSNPIPFRGSSVEPARDLIPRIGLTCENSRTLCLLLNRAHFKKIDL
jgi:peptidoglycan/xylan/chitin deacetylase (PgdA/CDA1 family)